MCDYNKLTTVMFLCLIPVIYTHPCGENPLRGFISLSRATGRNVNRLLGILETANSQLFKRIEGEWMNYANCVGMVDTGYFKRSSENKRDFTDENSRDSSSWLMKHYSSLGVNEKKRDLSNDNEELRNWMFRGLDDDILPLPTLHHSSSLDRQEES